MKSIHRVIGGLSRRCRTRRRGRSRTARTPCAVPIIKTPTTSPTASNTSADITDVYVFPSPTNPANVVLVMDVSPLIPAGMGTAKFFDPDADVAVQDLARRDRRRRSSHPVGRHRHRREPRPQRVRSGQAERSRYDEHVRSRRPATSPYNTPTTLPNGMQVVCRPARRSVLLRSLRVLLVPRRSQRSAHTSQSDPGTGDALANSNNVGAAQASQRPAANARIPHAVVRRLHGGTLRTRRLRLPHGLPAQNALGRSSAAASTCSRSSSRFRKTLLTTGYSSPGHSRLGDGQLVDRSIGAHDEIRIHLLALGALGFGLAACGGGNSINTTPSAPAGQTYTQIELLSRPAVKELFEKFVDHQTTQRRRNRTPIRRCKARSKASPTRCVRRTPRSAAITARRSPSVLYPELDHGRPLANRRRGVSRQRNRRRDLGHQEHVRRTRASRDDVIDISLGAVFGNTLAALSLQPEDNEENNCLTTDHVAQNAVASADRPRSPTSHTPH